MGNNFGHLIPKRIGTPIVSSVVISDEFKKYLELMDERINNLEEKWH